MKKVAAGFHVVPRTVSRIWKRALKAREVTGLWSAASLWHHHGRPTKDVAAKLERLRGGGGGGGGGEKGGARATCTRNGGCTG
ncbi:hypothetical protein JG687_00016116 [Phytophthora cactorum]|uniref:Uncharacterized protein n=1 Tax=Phytophthora cactorum TaxID=29920 RepID=A0A8T1TRW6_9STRA|nr:hypothetical protein JG687_00016116 [Phytophthora cactorum]